MKTVSFFAWHIAPKRIMKNSESSYWDADAINTNGITSMQLDFKQTKDKSGVRQTDFREFHILRNRYRQ